MIDPINPNQNQQNISTNMNNQTQSQNVVSTQSQSDNALSGVGVSAGKPEFGPIIDVKISDDQSLENSPVVESSGEFSDPNVGGEVKDLIKVKKDFPEIDDSAKQAGISETIPSGPVYGNFPANIAAAELDFEKKPVTSADKWRALEAIKSFGRNLLGQSKTSEV